MTQDWEIRIISLELSLPTHKGSLPEKPTHRKRELRDEKRLISDKHLEPTMPEGNALRTF